MYLIKSFNYPHTKIAFMSRLDFVQKTQNQLITSMLGKDHGTSIFTAYNTNYKNHYIYASTILNPGKIWTT